MANGASGAGGASPWAQILSGVIPAYVGSAYALGGTLSYGQRKSKEVLKKDVKRLQDKDLGFSEAQKRQQLALAGEAISARGDAERALRQREQNQFAPSIAPVEKSIVQGEQAATAAALADIQARSDIAGAREEERILGGVSLGRQQQISLAATAKEADRHEEGAARSFGESTDNTMSDADMKALKEYLG